LALVGAYFGDSAREYLNANIYKPFEKAESELEQAYREVHQKSDTPYNFSGLLKQLDQINKPVCQLGLFMMTRLRGGLVERRIQLLRRFEEVNRVLSITSINFYRNGYVHSVSPLIRVGIE